MIIYKIRRENRWHEEFQVVKVLFGILAIGFIIWLAVELLSQDAVITSPSGSYTVQQSFNEKAVILCDTRSQLCRPALVNDNTHTIHQVVGWLDDVHLIVEMTVLGKKAAYIVNVEIEDPTPEIYLE